MKNILLTLLAFLSLSELRAQNCQAGFYMNWAIGTAPLTVTFTNTSTGGNSNTTYSWNFGDGGNSSATSPIYTYNSAGMYAVCLTMTNTGAPACTSTFCDTVYVSASSCNISMNGTVSYDTVTVTNTTVTQPCNWEWIWGDGTTTFQTSPATHIYATPGWHAVILHYFCDCFVADSFQTTMPITCNPSFTDSIISDSVTFQFFGSVGGCNWIWKFGDGDSSFQSTNVGHVYAPGGYLACVQGLGSCSTCIYCDSILIASNGINSINSSNENISLFPNPTQNSSIIEFNIEGNSLVEINLFDVQGRKIISVLNKPLQRGKYSEQLSIADLSSGVYLLKMKTGKSVKTIKVVKE